MPQPRQRRLDQVLRAPSTRLAALTAQTQRLAALDRQLRTMLAPDLAEHCRVAGFEGGRLIVAAPTSSWATRLRYHITEIRQMLVSAGESVTAVKVIVLPPAHGPKAAAGPPPVLSARSAELIESTAAGIDHGPLAAALRRLARNGRRGGPPEP